VIKEALGAVWSDLENAVKDFYDIVLSH